MPANYLRNLSSIARKSHTDLALARYLTFVAGAANAGGFLAVKMYTSHMSGIVASMADALVLGQLEVVLTALGALTFFLLGAATTAMLVNWARRNNLYSRYALPLLTEAALLLVFGLLGGRFHDQLLFFVSLTVMLLCFLMGVQNALITKISNARIRTTHITGMVTDIGIELGKLMYWNRPSTETDQQEKVLANRENLRVLCSLVGLFFLGGLTGAIGFKTLGYSFTVPLALLVFSIGVVPAWDDIQSYRKGRTAS